MRKLLLVDDDPSVRNPLEEFLKEEGYDVDTAANGEEGLERYRNHHPQIVILDLRMPQMGGIQFLEQLNRNTNLSASVIVLTGYDTDEDIQQCFELGIQSFLRKPVNLYELSGLLKNMFKTIDESSQLRGEIEKKETDYRDLETQHNKLRKTFDSINEGIVTLDRNLNVEMISAHACQILELEENEVRGKRAGTVFQPSIAGPDGVLSKCIQEKSEFSDGYLQYTTLSGQQKPISLTVTPISSASTEDGWLLILRNRGVETHLPPKDTGEFSFGRMVGGDPKMKKVFDLIEKISSSKASVLIQGNSGTGKELVAREIHDLSNRRHQPFHAVNCAAISPNLLESEFFGHERGAFTGAQQTKKGRFELAHGGTLFLDEMGELPLELQGKLLRALQEQTFERVGGTKAIQVDVRVIAATNQELKTMIQNNQFREDLYFRLCVVSIILPDLYERQDDIPLLASSFIKELNQRENRKVKEISKGALRKLTHYSWPGNVRELYNVIEFAFAISSGTTLQIEHLPVEIQKSSSQQKHHSLSSQGEKEMIIETLQKTDFHKVKAAGLLGMHPATLYRKLKKYGIE